MWVIVSSGAALVKHHSFAEYRRGSSLTNNRLLRSKRVRVHSRSD
jgi:hypothetical protein